MRDLKSDELKPVYGGYGGRCESYTKPLKHSFSVKGFKFKDRKDRDNRCFVGNSTIGC